MNPKRLNILSWAALFYGLFFAGFGMTSYKQDVGQMLIIMGVLCTTAGITGIIILKKKKLAFAEDNLNRIFYEIIKKNKGKITALEFAIAINQNPSTARAFIEAKAIQLVAITEIDDEGTITYIFK